MWARLVTSALMPSLVKPTRVSRRFVAVLCASFVVVAYGWVSCATAGAPYSNESVLEKGLGARLNSTFSRFRGASGFCGGRATRGGGMG